MSHSSGKKVQPVTILKENQSKQLNRLKYREDQLLNLLDDVSLFGKLRGDIEREYAQSLLKITRTFRAKKDIFLSLEQAELDSNEEEFRSVNGVWKKTLEETERVAKQRLKASEVYLTQATEPAKTLKELKQPLIKKTLEAVAVGNKGVMRTVEEMAKFYKEYADRETVAAKAADKIANDQKKGKRSSDKAIKQRDSSAAKATVSRNNYLLQLSATNAHIQWMQTQEVPDLMKIMDEGLFEGLKEAMVALGRTEVNTCAAIAEGYSSVTDEADKIDREYNLSFFKSCHPALDSKLTFPFDPAAGDRIHKMVNDPLTLQQLKTETRKWASKISEETKRLKKSRNVRAKLVGLRDADKGLSNGTSGGGSKKGGNDHSELDAEIATHKADIQRSEVAKLKAEARLGLLGDAGIDVEAMLADAMVDDADVRSLRSISSSYRGRLSSDSLSMESDSLDNGSIYAGGIHPSHGMRGSQHAPHVAAGGTPPPPARPRTPSEAGLSQQEPTFEPYRVVALYDYTAGDEEEMSFQEGDIIEIYHPDEGQGWLSGRREADGQVGFIPANYVEPWEPEPPAMQPPPMISQNGPSPVTNKGKQSDSPAGGQRETGLWARCLYAYQPMNDQELSFLEDDILQVMSTNDNGVDDGYWKGELDGRVGVFPAMLVEKLPSSENPFVTAKPVFLPESETTTPKPSARKSSLRPPKSNFEPNITLQENEGVRRHSNESNETSEPYPPASSKASMDELSNSRGPAGGDYRSAYRNVPPPVFRDEPSEASSYVPSSSPPSSRYYDNVPSAKSKGEQTPKAPSNSAASIPSGALNYYGNSKRDNGGTSTAQPSLPMYDEPPEEKEEEVDIPTAPVNSRSQKDGILAASRRPNSDVGAGGVKSSSGGGVRSSGRSVGRVGVRDNDPRYGELPGNIGESDQAPPSAVSGGRHADDQKESDVVAGDRKELGRSGRSRKDSSDRLVEEDDKKWPPAPSSLPSYDDPPGERAAEDVKQDEKNMSKMEMGQPKPSLPPKPSITAPKPSITAPKPNISAPKPDISAPEPDISTSQPDISTPQPDISTPKPDMSAPKPDSFTPSPDISAPKPDISTPDPDISYPKPDISTPKSDNSTPKPDISTPYSAVSEKTETPTSETARGLRMIRRDAREGSGRGRPNRWANLLAEAEARDAEKAKEKEGSGKEAAISKESDSKIAPPKAVDKDPVSRSQEELSSPSSRSSDVASSKEGKDRESTTEEAPTPWRSGYVSRRDRTVSRDNPSGAGTSSSSVKQERQTRRDSGSDSGSASHVPAHVPPRVRGGAAGGGDGSVSSSSPRSPRKDPAPSRSLASSGYDEDELSPLPLPVSNIKPRGILKKRSYIDNAPVVPTPPPDSYCSISDKPNRRLPKRESTV